MTTNYKPVALVATETMALRMKEALTLVGIDASVRAFSCKWEVLTSVGNRVVGNLVCKSIINSYYV